MWALITPPPTPSHPKSVQELLITHHDQKVRKDQRYLWRAKLTSLSANSWRNGPNNLKTLITNPFLRWWHRSVSMKAHHTFHSPCCFSQTEPQQIHYSHSEAQYQGATGSVSVATMPFHPALLEHYLPQVPTVPRSVPTSLPRERERERERERPPSSEGDESDGGERSEGELVLLTDWRGVDWWSQKKNGGWTIETGREGGSLNEKIAPL